MTLALPTPSSTPVASRWRWGAALLLGTALWLAATVASQFVPQVVLGLPLEGATFALVGLLQAVLGPLAVALALRVVGARLRDVGFTADQWREDALVGAAVAVAFALVQLLVIVPATGGAARSDVVANAAQIGDSPWGVVGFTVLAWGGGGLSEELFARGLFFTGLWTLFGRSQAATVAAVAVTTVLFALSHGYQGGAGILDTGLYGGLGLTLLYLWRGRRLTAGIVAHALWNTLAAIGIFLWA